MSWTHERHASYVLVMNSIIKINKTCVGVGAYITCYSRLKLLKHLNKLPPNTVLYYDTDSIIYYSQHMDKLLETESKLGCLTSELDDGEYITSFISTGPKSYSFTTSLSKEITHVKGFKLSKKSKNKTIISPDYLYEMMNNFNKTFDIEQEDEFVIQKDLLIRKENVLKIFSFTLVKTFDMENRNKHPTLGYIPITYIHYTS